MGKLNESVFLDSVNSSRKLLNAKGVHGTPRVCSWLGKSVVAWAPHLQLASELGVDF